MKKVMMSILLALLVLTALPTNSFAEYIEDGDVTLSVTLLEDELETSGETGETTFELQEGAHDTLTDTTGQEVDHSYVWIEVNGEKVLAIDPPKPCF